MSTMVRGVQELFTLSKPQAGFGVAGASGLVASVFLTLKAILKDLGSMNEVPLVQRKSRCATSSAARSAAGAPGGARPLSAWSAAM